MASDCPASAEAGTISATSGQAIRTVSCDQRIPEPRLAWADWVPAGALGWTQDDYRSKASGVRIGPGQGNQPVLIGHPDDALWGLAGDPRAVPDRSGQLGTGADLREE